MRLLVRRRSIPNSLCNRLVARHHQPGKGTERLHMNDTPTPDPHTTKVRVAVRMLDTLAADLAKDGTEYEQAVGVLLSYATTIIVNDELTEAITVIEQYVPLRPRADRLEAARVAAQVEVDRLDLPDSYTGIGD